MQKPWASQTRNQCFKGQATSSSLARHRPDYPYHHQRSIPSVWVFYPADRNVIPATDLVPASFHPITKGIEEEPPKTCGTCGQFLGLNPLVRNGLVSSHWADVPPPMPPQPAKRSSRVVATGRVISGDEMLEALNVIIV